MYMFYFLNNAYSKNIYSLLTACPKLYRDTNLKNVKTELDAKHTF